MSGCYYSFHIKVNTSRHAVAVKVVFARNLTLLGNMFLRGLKIFPTHGRCIDACSINTKLSTKSKLVIYDYNLIIILMCMILDISGRILPWKIGLGIFCVFLWSEHKIDNHISPFCDSCFSTFSTCSQPKADLSMLPCCTPNFPPNPVL